MKLKKLIVKEFTVKDNTKYLKSGERYSHFQDPKTKKYYRPTDKFIVTGEDLTNRFVEL